MARQAASPLYLRSISHTRESEVTSSHGQAGPVPRYASHLLWRYGSGMGRASSVRPRRGMGCRWGVTVGGGWARVRPTSRCTNWPTGSLWGAAGALSWGQIGIPVGRSGHGVHDRTVGHPRGTVLGLSRGLPTPRFAAHVTPALMRSSCPWMPHNRPHDSQEAPYRALTSDAPRGGREATWHQP